MATPEQRALRAEEDLKRERIANNRVRENLTTIIAGLQDTCTKLIERIAAMQESYTNLAAMNLTLKGK